MTAPWTDEQMQALQAALTAARDLLDLPQADGSTAYNARRELLANRASSVRTALGGLVEAFDSDHRLPALRGARSFLDDTHRLMAVNYETVEDR